MSWHDRPVLAPVLYGAGTFLVGLVSYAFGYLLTGHIRTGIYVLLFMDGLLVLYFRESHRAKGAQEWMPARKSTGDRSSRAGRKGTHAAR